MTLSRPLIRLLVANPLHMPTHFPSHVNVPTETPSPLLQQVHKRLYPQFKHGSYESSLAGTRGHAGGCSWALAGCRARACYMCAQPWKGSSSLGAPSPGGTFPWQGQGKLHTCSECGSCGLPDGQQAATFPTAFAMCMRGASLRLARTMHTHSLTHPAWLTAPYLCTLQGERANQASDVFAFAVVLWELLT